MYRPANMLPIGSSSRPVWKVWVCVAEASNAVENFVPQPPQKRVESGFSAWHRGHLMDKRPSFFGKKHIN
jgi:hypothetical protein